MDKKIYGALKRIIQEVKEYRKLPTNKIGGNDINLVEAWIDEVAKDYSCMYDHNHAIKNECIAHN